MKPILTLLFLATALYSQITVSYSPQGPDPVKAATRKKLKNLQFVGVEVCTTSPVELANGWLYQEASRLGYSYLLPQLATNMVMQSSNRHWTNIATVLLVQGTLIGAGFASSGVINMSAGVAKRVTTGLVTAHGSMDSIQAILKPFQPDPAILLDLLLDPRAKSKMEAGSCMDGIFAAAYPGGRQVTVATGVVNGMPDIMNVKVAQ